MLVYYSTKSKVKPKLKPKSERTEYEAWCKKHSISPTGTKKKQTIGNDKSPVVVTGVYRRETPSYPSVDTGMKGAVTCAKTSQVYTGDSMIGIASMHKSNLVPVFKESDAVEISQMRR